MVFFRFGVLSFVANCNDVEVLARWPYDYMEAKSYAVHLAKCRIHCALHVASAMVRKAFEQVVVIDKPRRLVRASAELAKAALVLVPNTMKITAKDAQEMVQDGEVVVELDMSEASAELRGVRFVLSPMAAQDRLCAAWVVRHVAEEQKSNVKWSTMRVSEVHVAELPHETKKASAPWSKSSAPVRGGAEHFIEVPVLVNTKVLKAGVELRVFRHKSEKRKEPAPVTLAKQMKTTLAR